MLTANHVSAAQAGLSCILLWLPWFSYCRWQTKGTSLIPLFSVIAIAQWASFGLLLFWGPVPSDPVYRIPFRDSTVTSVLVIAVWGTLALWAGMSLKVRPIRAGALPDLTGTVASRRYVYAVLAAGLIAGSAGVDLQTLGSGGRQWVATLQIIVPVAVFAFLLRRAMKGEADRTDRWVLYSFITLRVVVGIASGWAGAVLSTAIIYCVVYVSEKRRLPVKLILFIAPVFLFLQAGKGAFRDVYWYGGHTGSTFQRAEFWLETSWKIWKAAYQGHNGKAGSLVTDSLGRVSLLDQAGNVYDKTPKPVPYQNGATYSYLAVTFIPRALWPNKPSVSEANRFYQVAYGLTSEDKLDTVSIAVGYLMESFINFGWLGIAPVMFVIGLLLGLFEKTLLAPDSGSLFSAIGIALVLPLIAVEGQAAQYIGGLVQQMLLTAAVFAPVIRRRVNRTDLNTGSAVAPA